MKDNSQPPLAEVKYAGGMPSGRIYQYEKAFTLTLCIGVMLFLCNLPALANKISDMTNALPLSEFHEIQTIADTADDARPHLSQEDTKSENRWLDTYPKKIGLTYGADVNVVGNYIWRGLYVGGLSVQGSANVGYGGLFVDVWCNAGATNWAFGGFNPEVDVSVGFSRWGFKLFVIHMCYFDGTGFFDFKNAAPGQAGNTTELRAGYKVSSKLPLSILWCTRFTSRDGYIAEDGTLQRAWSSYLELGYDFALPYDMTLMARVGMTPWKSLYTGYEGDFALNNIALTLRKDWSLSAHCGLHLSADIMLNPWRITRENIRWSASNPYDQRLNANISCGIYLK